MVPPISARSQFALRRAKRYARLASHAALRTSRRRDYLDVVLAERHLLARTSGVVPSGPFAGLRMTLRDSWGWWATFLAGSYEAEIQPWVEELVGHRPPVVVDVGCAGGYYAVGLARRLPDAVVHAFDIDDDARAECRTLAALNDVEDRVVTGGWCSAATLQEICPPGSLVIADCEGGEVELLDPAAAPALEHVTILVELHAFVRPEVEELLVGRFEPTHRIELVEARPRRAADWPVLEGLDPRLAAKVLDELRPVDPHPMRWALMRPLAAD